MAESDSLAGLTRGQRRAIPALLECPTIADAAGEAQLSERTVYRYLAEPAFQEALRAEQARVINASTAAVIGTRPRAVQTLLEALETDTASWAEKIRAAHYLMGHAQTAIELDALTARLERLEKLIDGMNKEGG